MRLGVKRFNRKSSIKILFVSYSLSSHFTSLPFSEITLMSRNFVTWTPRATKYFDPKIIGHSVSWSRLPNAVREMSSCCSFLLTIEDQTWEKKANFELNNALVLFSPWIFHIPKVSALLPNLVLHRNLECPWWKVNKCIWHAHIYGDISQPEVKV